MSVPYFDEVTYTKFFHVFIFDHQYKVITVHPLLWGLLTWPFIAIFGEGMVPWRIISLFSGILSILVVYALAQRITRNNLVAIFAVFFFAFDCLSLTQARVAMMNSLCLFWMLLSLYIFLDYWINQKSPKTSVLLGTGICLGLALSTKLMALSMVLMIYGLFIQRLIQEKDGKLALLGKGLLFLFVLPVLIYFAVYAWMFSLPGCTWHHIWFIQQFNFNYNLKVAASLAHPYSSFWWEWPLLLRPMWFYFAHQNGTVNGIFCIGNPIIFWMVPLMTIYLAWYWACQGRLASIGIILLGFLSQWLFYAPSLRLAFFYYFYSSLPFVALGLAWICAQMWQSGNKTGKLLVTLYMIAVLGMFIYWYPLLTGFSISEAYYRNHIWFSSWI